MQKQRQLLKNKENDWCLFLENIIELFLLIFSDNFSNGNDANACQGVLQVSWLMNLKNKSCFALIPNADFHPDRPDTSFLDFA